MSTVKPSDGDFRTYEQYEAIPEHRAEERMRFLSAHQSAIGRVQAWKVEQLVAERAELRLLRFHIPAKHASELGRPDAKVTQVVDQQHGVILHDIPEGDALALCQVLNELHQRLEALEAERDPQ
jgi:hypothetical protein